MHAQRHTALNEEGDGALVRTDEATLQNAEFPSGPDLRGQP